MNVLRMLRAGGWFGVYCDAPDANAGGGQTHAADPTGAMPAGGDSSDGDPDAGGDAGEAGDEAIDDDTLLLGDDDTGQAETRSLEEQHRALRKAHRKLQRRFLNARPTLARLKGIDLDDLVTRARQFDTLQAESRRNPRLRALLQGGETDAEPTRDRRPTTESDLPPLPTAFTAETLGFDPNDGVANKAAANLFAHVARLQRQVQDLLKLQPTVQTLERGFTARTVAEERSTWNSALTTLETELKKVAPGNDMLLTFARDAVIGAYQTRQQHGRSAKQIVQGYIDRLAKAGAISKKQAGQLSAATQARMATHNTTLPRSPAGGGTPSSAQGTQRPTLKDVHRKLRQGLVGPR